MDATAPVSRRRTMLVLTRKCGEKVVIGGTITLILLSCDGGRVRLGITAPDDVCILRGELLSQPGHPGEGTLQPPVNVESAKRP
jgi:carbon storage regulator